MLSAVVTRRQRDLDTVKLVDRVRSRLKKPPRANLHFRNMGHQQRLVLVEEISQARLRAVNVLVHKPSIQEPENFSDRFRLYFYSARLLLERTSWLCRDRRREDDGDGSAKIFFSNRSSMSYEELREYLRRLEELSGAQDIRIDWTVVRPDQVIPQPAHQMMGLQIADAVASSFFVALERSGYGFTEDRYVRMMKDIIYKHRGQYLGYGIKLFPSDAEMLVESDQHQAWYPLFKKSRPPA